MCAPLFRAWAESLANAGEDVDFHGSNTRWAILSEGGKYRYALGRAFDDTFFGGGQPAIFFMVNPSTADHVLEDPTLGRCISFAQAWGCSGVVVVNLFAFRTSDPSELPARGAVGRHNDSILRYALTLETKHAVIAWGNRPGPITRELWAERRSKMQRLFGAAARTPIAFGSTQSGEPLHPLYLSKARQPSRYDWDEPKKRRTG